MKLILIMLSIIFITDYGMYVGIKNELEPKIEYSNNTIRQTSKEDLACFEASEKYFKSKRVYIITEGNKCYATALTEIKI